MRTLQSFVPIKRSKNCICEKIAYNVRVVDDIWRVLVFFCIPLDLAQCVFVSLYLSFSCLFYFEIPVKLEAAIFGLEEIVCD